MLTWSRTECLRRCPTVTSEVLEKAVAHVRVGGAEELPLAALAGRLYRREMTDVGLTTLPATAQALLDTDGRDKREGTTDGSTDRQRLVTDGGIPTPEAGGETPVYVFVEDEVFSPRSVRVEEGAGADRLYVRVGACVDVEKGDTGTVVATVDDERLAVPVTVEGAEALEDGRATITLRPRFPARPQGGEQW